MSERSWHWSELYGFWYIPEHPEAGRIFQDDMPEELKEETWTSE
jgi:hypothetical protein